MRVPRSGDWALSPRLWIRLVAYERRTLTVVALSMAAITALAVVLIGVRGSLYSAEYQTASGANGGFRFAVTARPGSAEFMTLRESNSPYLSGGAENVATASARMAATVYRTNSSRVLRNYGETTELASGGVAVTQAVAESLGVNAGERVRVCGRTQTVGRIALLPSAPDLRAVVCMGPIRPGDATRWLTDDLDGTDAISRLANTDSQIRLSGAGDVGAQRASAIEFARLGAIRYAPIACAFLALMVWAGVSVTLLGRWERHARGLRGAGLEARRVVGVQRRALAATLASGVAIGTLAGVLVVLGLHEVLGLVVRQSWTTGAVPLAVVAPTVIGILALGAIASEVVLREISLPRWEVDVRGSARSWFVTGILVAAVAAALAVSSGGVSDVRIPLTVVGGLGMALCWVQAWGLRRSRRRPAVGRVQSHVLRRGLALNLVLSAVMMLGVMQATWQTADASASARVNEPLVEPGSVVVDGIVRADVGGLRRVLGKDARIDVFPRADERASYWRVSTPSFGRCAARVGVGSSLDEVYNRCDPRARSAVGVNIVSFTEASESEIVADPRLIRAGLVSFVRFDSAARLTDTLVTAARPDDRLGNLAPGAVVPSTALPGPPLEGRGDLIVVARNMGVDQDAEAASAQLQALVPTAKVAVGQPVDVTAELSGAWFAIAATCLLASILLTSGLRLADEWLAEVRHIALSVGLSASKWVRLASSLYSGMIAAVLIGAGAGWLTSVALTGSARDGGVLPLLPLLLATVLVALGLARFRQSG